MLTIIQSIFCNMLFWERILSQQSQLRIYLIATILALALSFLAFFSISSWYVLGMITPSFILFSNSGRVMVSVRYFSIIKVAIGAAHEAPQPPFSTIIPIAIFGFSLGAKPTKREWSCPCGFCAVPV